MKSKPAKKSKAPWVAASAPCRVDLGGTLDIKTFYYPLRHLAPCTFNIALTLRTRVSLYPNDNSRIKVTSRGFESAEYALPDAPFAHPLGLMFAVAAYFGAEGIHIDIDSSSPPKSALGGSSAAAVALIAAFQGLQQGRQEIGNFYRRRKIACLAQEIEESIAGVPCGLQDQLAAVYGGINNWHWLCDDNGTAFKRAPVFHRSLVKKVERRLLLAYCGVTHESKDINRKWVRRFLEGRQRGRWKEIITCTKNFAAALIRSDFAAAARELNRETLIRREMTPEVLDEMGEALAAAAMAHDCGARFTGAGGGGCIWALGEVEHIDRLRNKWKSILAGRPRAALLDVKIDEQGIRFD